MTQALKPQAQIDPTTIHRRLGEHRKRPTSLCDVPDSPLNDWCDYRAGYEGPGQMPVNVSRNSDAAEKSKDKGVTFISEIPYSSFIKQGAFTGHFIQV